MSAIVCDGASHAHSWSALKQTLGDDRVCFGDAGQGSGDSQDPIVDALDDLAHASFDASLFSKICDILPCFSDDDSSFSARDDCS